MRGKACLGAVIVQGVATALKRQCAQHIKMDEIGAFDMTGSIDQTRREEIDTVENDESAAKDCGVQSDI